MQVKGVSVGEDVGHAGDGVVFGILAVQGYQSNDR